MFAVEQTRAARARRVRVCVRCQRNERSTLQTKDGLSMFALSKYSIALAGLALAVAAQAQVTFYEDEGFGGRSFNTSSVSIP